MDKELIKALATPNWRGISVGDLVCELQQKTEELEDMMKVPTAFIDELHREGTLEDRKYFLTCWCGSILGELKRRKENPVQITADQDTIRAIKEKVDILEVLSWYVTVNTYKSNFKCNLHSGDSTPSGKVYKAQNTYWCYGCNKGGDVFEVLKNYGRMDFTEALKTLSVLTGISVGHKEGRCTTLGKIYNTI